MGRHVGRSKGCQICIKRRIKCNEEEPECYQCISSGWKCPGPVKGAVFIDMSEGIRQSQTREISRHSNRKALEPKKRNSCPNSAAIAPNYDPVKRMQVVSQASRLPSAYQPHRGEIFQNLYIANFISLQDSCLHPWIVELPKLASTSSSTQSELYGIRAATFALYARLSHNRDLELEASKWYAKGLDAQREQLPLAARTPNYQPYYHQAIIAAMMFSYFESVICTVPMGWMQHYAAAIKMLEIAGPKNCQAGLMHMFFRSMRVAAFIISLTNDEASVFASETWCTVPFDQMPKTSFDELVDLLLQLPSCLPSRNEMRKTRNNNPTKSHLLRRYLGATAKNLHSRLDEFWQEHKNEIDPDYDQRLQAISSQLTSEEDGHQPMPCIQQFKSSFDAYFTSMYDAGKVIALGLLGAASLVPNSYNQAILLHSASILICATYCESQGLYNGVSFAMVFPIKLICLLSPSEEQRTLARNVLLKWGSERGLADSCEVAAPSYLDRSHG